MSFLRQLRFPKFSKELFSTDTWVKQAQQSSWHPDDETLLETQTMLERILTKNIVPFWYPGVIDNNDGGYRLNHDLEGRWRGPANKCLVTQATDALVFFTAGQLTLRAPEHLEAARHGYDFLRDRMWDKEFGGFYWEVGASGHAATRTEKQMYGQAFALYALTEYALASGDPAAKGIATELFNLMETKGHDTKHGGYRDILQRDWSPVPKRATTNTDYALGIKRMNTHLHLLEAITTFLVSTDELRARQRLVELIFVKSNSVVEESHSL